MNGTSTESSELSELLIFFLRLCEYFEKSFIEKNVILMIKLSPCVNVLAYKQ